MDEFVGNDDIGEKEDDKDKLDHFGDVVCSNFLDKLIDRTQADRQFKFDRQRCAPVKRSLTTLKFSETKIF